MKNEIKIGIYRIRDNRYESLPKDSKELVALHNIRRDTLHELFDNQEAIKVTDWGNTNDTTSHEWIEIIVSAVSAGIVSPLLMKGLEELGKKLVEKGFEEVVAEGVKGLIAVFSGKQKEKKLGECAIKPDDDGTVILVNTTKSTSTITMHKGGTDATRITYHIKK